MKTEIPDIDHLHEVHRLLESAVKTMPLVQMTEAEKSKFRQDTWDNRYGPALARIGHYLIYFDGQEAPLRAPEIDRPICSSCHNEVDLDMCWCGEAKQGHPPEHNFVPMGCTCGFGKQPETKPPFP